MANPYDVPVRIRVGDAFTLVFAMPKPTQAAEFEALRTKEDPQPEEFEELFLRMLLDVEFDDQDKPDDWKQQLKCSELLRGQLAPEIANQLFFRRNVVVDLVGVERHEGSGA